MERYTNCDYSQAEQEQMNSEIFDLMEQRHSRETKADSVHSEKRSVSRNAAFKHAQQKSNLPGGGQIFQEASNEWKLNSIHIVLKFPPL